MAVALAAYSAYQGMQAQEAASDQAEKQNKMNEENLAFSRQRYSENKARRDKEEELFRPIKERVIGEAQSDKPAGWDKQANIINQGYGDVIRRASAGNQNSGLGASMVQGANLGKTSSLASAYSDAKEKQRLSLTSLMGTGMQSAQSMTGDVNQSGRDQSTQMGSMANAYGANAAGLGQAASNAYGNAITGVGRAWAGGEFGKIGSAFGKGYDFLRDNIRGYGEGGEATGSYNPATTDGGWDNGGYGMAGSYSSDESTAQRDPSQAAMFQQPRQSFQPKSSIDTYSNIIPTSINTDWRKR